MQDEILRLLPRAALFALFLHGGAAPCQEVQPSQVLVAPPDPPRAMMFREREVRFGTEDWMLPGTLNLPTGKRL